MLVGITQRAVAVPGRGEVRDALDQAWTGFLQACGLDFVAIPNNHPDPVAYARGLGVQGIILSGGGNISEHLGTLGGQPVQAPVTQSDLSPQRDRTETALLRAAWPVLGVCRGMQAMNLFHGGSLAPMSGHAGTTHPLESLDDSLPFAGHVNSFHDFAVLREGLGKGLVAKARAGDSIEAFIHESLPHVGIMWHPERVAVSAEADIKLFRQFFGVAT